MSVFVWTDMDLDGGMCLFLLEKLYGQELDYEDTSVSNFDTKFSPWILKNKDKYDKIFICDLDVSKCKDLVDHDNVVIIDHHKSHVDNKEYKNATTIIKEYTSAAMLLYDVFKSKLTLNKYQLVLLKLVDDYDCYACKFKESKMLNMVFWSYKGARPRKFINDFKDGFTGFNTFHVGAINIFNQNLESVKNTLNVHRGKIKLGSKEYTVYGGFADSVITEAAQYILDEYKCDISFIVNLKGSRVSWRKRRDCDAPLDKIAMNLCDGGGHDGAAGGFITDKFLELTKQLKPINERKH